MLMRGLLRSKFPIMLTTLVVVAVVALPLAISTIGAHVAYATKLSFPAKGNLDCNGFSKIQKPLRTDMACTDFVGYDGRRGYDNGHYIGHDEPTINFFSNSPGSGNNVQ